MKSDYAAGTVLADPAGEIDPAEAIDRTARAIDDAARAIATSQGLTAITLRRMSSVSGLSPADVASREPSMGALAARTFAELAATEMERIGTDVDAAPTPGDALRQLVTDLLSSDHSLSKTVWADAWSVGRHNAFVAAAARRSMVAWQNLLVGLIETGIAAGQFTTSDPGFVARQFFSVIDSTTVYGLVGYLADAERAELVRRTLETALGLPDSFL